jgi:hypothetical protein
MFFSPVISWASFSSWSHEEPTRAFRLGVTPVTGRPRRFAVARKQQRTPEARRALALHASTYAVTQAVYEAAFYRTACVRVPLRAQLAGAIVEGVLHAVIDDDRLLRRFAEITKTMRFHDLADHGVNGRMLLDQAAHQQLQIPAGTIATVAVATMGRASGPLIDRSRCQTVRAYWRTKRGLDLDRWIFTPGLAC